MIRNDLVLPVGDSNEISYYLPAEYDHKLPVIICTQGFGGTRELGPSSKALCEQSMKIPMAFVSFSPYGFGATSGNDNEFSYGRWSSNIEDVYKWITKQEWADINKIGCFSISSGTTAAIRYAQRSTDLKFVISVATALSLHVGMSHSPVMSYLENALVKHANGIPQYFSKNVSALFYIDFITHNPIFKIGEIKCPVFFLQGRADNVWRRSDAWIGYQKMKENGQCTKYMEIENGDHNLDQAADLCANEVIGWLKEIAVI